MTVKKYTTTIRLTTISMVVLGLTGAAHAGEVRLIGSTQGRFNADAFASTDTLLGLTFSNSTFDNTTVGGQMDLGGDPAPGVNFNNLGSLTLDRVNHSYTGNHFDLKITFTAHHDYRRPIVDVYRPFERLRAEWFGRRIC